MWFFFFQFYGSGGCSLELVGRDGCNGRTPSAFVRNPVKRILGRVLAIAPQTAPVFPHKLFVLIIYFCNN